MPLQCSNTLNNYLGKSERTIKAKLECSAGTITDIIRIEYSIGGNSYFTIGNTASAYITVRCLKPNFTLPGRELSLYFGGPSGTNGAYEWMLMGKFKITGKTATRDGVVEFTAYDKMYHATNGIYISSLSYPTSMSTVMSEICNSCGLNTPSLPFETSISSDMFSRRTYREAIGYIAGFYGRDAVVEPDGTLKFIAMLDGQATYYTRSYAEDIEDDDISLTFISCNVGNGKTYYSGSGANGVYFNNPYVSQSRCDSMVNYFNRTYAVGTMKMPQATPKITYGDTMSLGNGRRIPVMELSLIYDGGLSLTASSLACNDGGWESMSEQSFYNYPANSAVANFNGLTQASTVDIDNMMGGG